MMLVDPRSIAGLLLVIGAVSVPAAGPSHRLATVAPSDSQWKGHLRSCGHRVRRPSRASDELEDAERRQVERDDRASDEPTDDQDEDRFEHRTDASHPVVE